MPASSFILALREKVGNDLLHFPTVSVLIFDEAGHVLLACHVEGNRWTTPGGMIEPYEIPADAALRETWEETGLTVRLDRVLGVFGGSACATTYSNGDQVSWTSTVFGATVVGGEHTPDFEETLELRYFDPDMLDGVDCTPHVRELLKAIRLDHDGAYFQPPTWSPK